MKKLLVPKKFESEKFFVKKKLGSKIGKFRFSGEDWEPTKEPLPFK